MTAPRIETAGHTPTPWSVALRNDERPEIHGSSNADAVYVATVGLHGDDRNADNAALIVEAVNQRQALLAEVAALRAALGALLWWADTAAIGSLDETEMIARAEATAQARAALKGDA